MVCMICTSSATGTAPPSNKNSSVGASGMAGGAGVLLPASMLRGEKKRARGRKGTVYNEEYIVNNVRRLVECVGVAGDEVARLVFGLAGDEWPRGRGLSRTCYREESAQQLSIRCGDRQ
ncbi:hypothetical protein QBC33DRAFT_603698 [Phialemonium atrogriseum]|uniref:Uncharacterized protein n=1 Tax=Phialemonium atrogriseum TaxID=1093897 RepID=A0AAJ0BTR8_9PEZI|nr:uncharacterized protein QBC33DRAFT_603698 [Phialemonium atrogriseum]KAK1761886.1 hypothetical protein QBC33DRAFT_603698 [Phialemonium atrogriseum]